MKVLVLSPYSSKLENAIQEAGDEVVVNLAPIAAEYCDQESIDFVISYGYRHIIRNDVLRILPKRIINLHISLLPWCRGAHPVFWSVVEKCPLGVTIHLIDEGLDTGDILIQRELTSELDTPKETFRTAYEFLSSAIEDLFCTSWEALRSGSVTGVVQQGRGSEHRASELNQWLDFMPMHWDTPIGDFLKLADAKINHHNASRHISAP